MSYPKSELLHHQNILPLPRPIPYKKGKAPGCLLLLSCWPKCGNLIWGRGSREGLRFDGKGGQDKTKPSRLVSFEGRGGVGVGIWVFSCKGKTRYIIARTQITYTLSLKKKKFSLSLIRARLRLDIHLLEFVAGLGKLQSFRSDALGGQ